MALKKEELQKIGEYVQDHLAEWLSEHAYNPVNFSFPLELTERMIRVEEELKNQRELMKQGFDQIDKIVDSGVSPHTGLETEKIKNGKF